MYRGRDPDGRSLTIAVVPGAPAEAQLAQLRRVLNRVAAVDHPGVVAVREVVPLSDALVLVSPVVGGRPLAEALGRQRPLAPAAVVRGAADVAGALAALHGAQVVHGGLHPSRIMVVPPGRPRVTGAGLEPWLSDGAGWGPVVTGTVGYVAPEVVAGGPPTPAGDVYALGVVCWEALVGERPFRGPTAAATLRAAARGTRPRLDEARPHLDRGLVGLIESALALRPEDRPGAQEMAGVLRAGPGPPAGRRRAGDRRRCPDSRERDRTPAPANPTRAGRSRCGWTRGEWGLLAAASVLVVLAAAGVLAGLTGLTTWMRPF